MAHREVRQNYFNKTLSIAYYIKKLEELSGLWVEPTGRYLSCITDVSYCYVGIARF